MIKLHNNETNTK